jgi:hypothetical protein
MNTQQAFVDRTNRGENRDRAVTAAKWGGTIAVAGEVAAASKGLTWLGAVGVFLTEALSPNKGF